MNSTPAIPVITCASNHRDAEEPVRSDALFESEAGKKSHSQQQMELPPNLRAQRAIERVLLAGHVVKLAFSSGKDSSAFAILMFNAAIAIAAAGYARCWSVSHADTGIESPVVRGACYCGRRVGEDACVRKGTRHSARNSCRAPHLERIVRHAHHWRPRPPLLPPERADCSQDWKVLPLQRGTAKYAQAAQTSRATCNG